MSFAQEIKDFVNGFTEARKLGMQSDLYKARQAYYNRMGGKNSNDQAVKDAVARGRENAGGSAIPAPKVEGKYGSDDPRTAEWQKNHLTEVTASNGQKWQVNKDAADDFKGFVGDMEKAGYTPKSSGGFNYRNIAGTNRLSNHAHGNAIDWDAENNARGTKGSFDADIVNQIANKWNLTWGGNWKNPDPMHFEWNGPRGDTGVAAAPAAPAPQANGAIPAPRYVTDMVDDDEEQASYTGGRIRPAKAYAQGGPVRAFTDDEMDAEDQADYEMPSPQDQPEGALPEPNAAPRSGGETNQPSGSETVLGAMLHGGLTFIQHAFGLNEANAAENSQAIPSTRNRDLGREMFQKGYGAADPKMVAELYKQVDPQGQLDDRIRTIAGLYAGYNEKMKQGDLDGANKFLASMLMYSQQTAAEYGSRAEDALKSGNFTAGKDLLLKAYDSTPDAHSVDVPKFDPKTGSGVLEQKDAKGNVTFSTPFTAQNLFDAATGMKSGRLYWDSLAQAAQKYLGANGSPSEAYQDAVEQLYGIPKDKVAASEGNAPAPAQAAPAQGAPAGAIPNAPQGGALVTPQGTDDRSRKEPSEAPAAPANPFMVPQKEVYMDSDVPSLPDRPEGPNLIEPDPKALSRMSKAERTDYAARVQQHNQIERQRYQTEAQAYNEALKGAKETRKQAMPKAHEFTEDQLGVLEDGIEKQIPTVLAAIPNPKGGKFGSPEEAGSFFGQDTMNVVGDVAKDIATYNPQFRTAKSSANAALSLAMPDTHDANKISFKPLGYAVGGRHVIVETAGGQQLVLSTAAYRQIARVHKVIGEKYRGAVEEANKPGLFSQGWRTFSDAQKRKYENMSDEDLQKELGGI